MDLRRVFGNAGEALAAAHLEAAGCEVVARQRRTPFGEIDLVCLDGSEVVFVEVKSRRSRRFGYPEEAVTTLKIRRMVKSAEQILREECWLDRPWRLDVIAIEFHHDPPQISHIKGIDMPENSW